MLEIQYKNFNKNMGFNTNTCFLRYIWKIQINRKAPNTIEVESWYLIIFLHWIVKYTY